jgi:hypothetical protein
MSAAHDAFGNPIFVNIKCATCTVSFGLHQPTYARRKFDSGDFYCPNGHINVFRDSDVTKLQNELKREKQLRIWAEENRDIARREVTEQKNRAGAYKGKFTHIRNRVSNGVCPCCTRTFQNLMRHMKTKHPAYKNK